MMDSQISKCRDALSENMKEEDFQAWEPEEGEVEETVATTQTNGNQYWSVDEMFKANKKLCSESDFASDLSQYQTTTVNATAEERERANEIARQIENDSLSRHNARLENDDEERNLDAKTNFVEQPPPQPSANHTSWRSQPNRSVNANNPATGGGGGGRVGFRGDRNNERGDSAGFCDRGGRYKSRTTHQQQQQLRSGASTTNVVTTTSISNALTSPTTSATPAKCGEAAATQPAIGEGTPPVTAPSAATVLVVAATTPSAQSVSAPNVTLVKETTPTSVDPPTLPPHPQQRPANTGLINAPAKFKFNPDAPAFVPAAAKKEMSAALSPSVTPITSTTSHGIGLALNNSGGGAMQPVYVVRTTTDVAPSIPGLPPQGIPMQFVPIQTYPPPNGFVYNMGPQHMVVSSGPQAGMIVQNHQSAVFQPQPQQQSAPMMQPPAPQAYPPPTSFVYKAMPPGGVPPHMIAASSGPSGGVIVPNHQQAASFQQQQPPPQQPQLIQQTNPQGYPPRNIVYGMLPGQPQVIPSSGGHGSANMIQVQGVQPGVYQQQPPPMIQPQTNAVIRKGPYGYGMEDGR